MNLNEIPNSATVLEALELGEGQQIELKSSIPDPASLGNLISAFANASGGFIIVGVREQANQIVGCDYPRLARTFDRVVEKLRPAVGITLHRIEIQGRDLGIIAVKPSTQVVTSESGVFVRAGEKIRAITVPEAERKLPPQAQEPSIAESLVILTQTIENLRSDLAYSRSFMGQLPGHIIAFVMGCLTGVIGNFIFSRL